jgi:hypothetical protein
VVRIKWCGKLRVKALVVDSAQNSAASVGIGQMIAKEPPSAPNSCGALLAVRVKPIDLGGNLLGPGQAVRVKSGGRSARVEDD